MIKKPPARIRIYEGMRCRHNFDIGIFQLTKHGVNGDFTKGIFQKETMEGNLEYVITPGSVYSWDEMTPI